MSAGSKRGRIAGPGAPGSANGAAHQGLIYRGAHELVAAAVPFVREGIATGAPVLVVLDAPKQALLRDALAGDAAGVEWVDPGVWYTFGPHTLYRAHQFADRHPGSTPRLLGEVVWTGRSAAEITEWARYEALVNVAFPHTPLLCAYDATALDEAIVATAGRTHPILHDAGATSDAPPRPSATYVDPAAFLAGCDTSVWPSPPGTAEVLGFGSRDLRTIRGLVTDRGAAAGLGDDRSADLATAVSEAATNATEHGGGYGVLWIWTDAARVICQIGNPGGPITDALAGHLPPDPRSPRGRGLWFMRQLADLVELRSDEHATSVRLHMWI